MNRLARLGHLRLITILEALGIPLGRIPVDGFEIYPQGDESVLLRWPEEIAFDANGDVVLDDDGPVRKPGGEAVIRLESITAFGNYPRDDQETT